MSGHTELSPVLRFINDVSLPTQDCRTGKHWVGCRTSALLVTAFALLAAVLGQGCHGVDSAVSLVLDLAPTPSIVGRATQRPPAAGPFTQRRAPAEGQRPPQWGTGAEATALGASRHPHAVDNPLLGCFTFTLASYVTGCVGMWALYKRNAGLFRRRASPSLATIAIYATSGEKSTVDILSGLLGEEPKAVAAPPAPVKASPPAIPKEQLEERLAALPLQDAAQQVAFLQSLGLAKWGSAGARLDYYPVPMAQLERVGLDAYALGIIENQADLETVKNYTAGVFVVFSALAVLAGALLPNSTGATLAYLLGAVPLVFLGIGSTVPGIITGAISAIENGKEGKGGNEDAAGINRRVRHEAAHFLTGYLVGLPVCSYDVEDATSRVEFYATARGDLQPGERFKKTELDKLCVVSLSGAVGETMSFSRAAGGGQDLRTLQRAFVLCEERIDAAKQQDQARWGALKARELLRMYDKEYQALCQGFARKLPVKDCIALIESC